MSANSKLSVTIVTPYFPPERGAPQQRWGELVRLLPAEGVEVEVFTNFPHYPSGRTYPPYRWRFWRRESWSGIGVTRVGSIQAPNRGLALRLIDQLSSGIVLAVALLVRPTRSDWVICEMPPVFTWLPLLAARLRGSRVGVYVADLWPESAVDMGLVRSTSRAVWLMRWITNDMYRRSALIFTTSQTQQRHCAALTNGACHWLPSAVDADRFPSGRRVGDTRATVTFAYVGTLGLAHSLEVLISASEDFPSETRLVIVGDGAARPRLEELASRSTRAAVMPSIPPAAIPSFYEEEVDIGVVSLGPARAFEGVLPSKLFEYLAAELPVLVVGAGEVAELALHYGVGVVARPGDPTSIAEAATHLLNMGSIGRERMGRRGRSLVQERFSRRQVARDFAAQLKRQKGAK